MNKKSFKRVICVTGEAKASTRWWWAETRK